MEKVVVVVLLLVLAGEVVERSRSLSVGENESSLKLAAMADTLSAAYAELTPPPLCTMISGSRHCTLS